MRGAGAKRALARNAKANPKTLHCFAGIFAGYVYWISGNLLKCLRFQISGCDFLVPFVFVFLSFCVTSTLVGACGGVGFTGCGVGEE